ncbi:HNH endonuclease [Clostridium sp. B9]|uniref:HNH endonuclease n=1 Tax=Clostridium sp. B9 TaxID=3423224 RepID=UPI003D2ECF56
MSDIITFQEEHPSLESYWRSVILFGRNVASYKFALAKSLLELSKEGKTEVTLEELAKPFSAHLCEHIKHSPKQATSKSSRVLDTCTGYNNGEVSYDELLSITAKLGFNNVIDAFHVVANGEIPVKFYEKDYSKQSKKIILTDEVFKLQELENSENFRNEVESRWNLVEKAWELNLSKSLLTVKYDEESKLFFVDEDNRFRRKDITSSRGALNGYQKGKCFYCFDDISVIEGSEDLCDVDHFFHHMLQPLMPEVNLNGVWNLVLSCKNCNRGLNILKTSFNLNTYIKLCTILKVILLEPYKVIWLFCYPKNSI